MNAKTNPELLDQLDRAGHLPVQVIVQLRPPEHPETIPTPEDAAKLADDVLARVSSEVGHPALRTNLLRHLATVVVEADSGFVRSLLRQPEVISALPNQTAESPFIPPKGKRPA